MQLTSFRPNQPASRCLLAILLMLLLLGSALGQDDPAIRFNDQGIPIATLEFSRSVSVQVILGEYTYQTGVPIAPQGNAGSIEAIITGYDMTPEQFLNRLASQNPLVWRKTADGYEVWDEETYNKQVLPTMVVQKIFIPENITATELEEAVKAAGILSAEISNISVDQRSNQMIVTDLPEKLALIQDLMALIDLPQYTRVFNIKYADLDDIVSKINEMRLKSDPGTVETDKLGRMLIVRDTLANIQRIESLIEVLDIRQPQRIYKLNSIGINDDEIDALKENLDRLVTQDAYYYVDARRGLLIVRDTPEVQKDVERYLKYFNTPVPQVLIQAELIEVSQSVNLSYGTDLSFSGDLPSAVADGLLSNFTSSGSNPGAPFGFVNYRREFPLGTSGAGGLSLRYLSSHVKAELSAALTDVNSRLLLRPNVVVKNRERASINVVTHEPIATAVPLGENTNQFSVTQSDVPSGLEVIFTPTITPTGLIELQLDISNSTAERIELATGLTTGIGSIQGVRRNKDDASTVMIIPSGETYVIGGLIRQTRSESINGIPGLVHIPWIGPLLFGSRSSITGNRNLLFFVTPTILQQPDYEGEIMEDLDAIAASWAPAAALPEASVPVSSAFQPGSGRLGEAEGFTLPTPTPVSGDNAAYRALDDVPGWEEPEKPADFPSYDPGTGRRIPDSPAGLDQLLQGGLDAPIQAAPAE